MQVEMSDKLFFDGRCPVCIREMRLLRRFKGDRLVLIDIHSSESASYRDNKSSNELLAVLHLKTSDGTWLLGLDAMVQAWSHTRAGWLLRPLRWPLIGAVADRIYHRWAARRACRLGYHCET